MTVRVPILLYHSIAEDVALNYRRWAVPPQLFASHLSLLRNLGYTALTVSQYVRTMADSGANSGAGLPTKPVVITFDDGLADFYTDALPLLQQFGFSATLYVTTRYVGQCSRWLTPDGEGDRAMMTWEQIAEAANAGIEIGAHTLTHPQLDTLAHNEAYAEIVQSKRALEDQLETQIESFAYPHGYYSRRLQRVVQEAGFTSACGVKHALSAPHDDRFALARVIVDGSATVHELDAWLSGEELRVAPTRERMRTKVWRLYRRTRRRLQRSPDQYGKTDDVNCLKRRDVSL